MDPVVTGPLIQYGALGILCVVLLALSIRFMKRGEEREERINKEAIERERLMREECAKREAVMRAECAEIAARLRSVEDKRAEESARLLFNNAETNKLNAETNRVFAKSLDRWVNKEDIGSGGHPSR